MNTIQALTQQVQEQIGTASYVYAAEQTEAGQVVAFGTRPFTASSANRTVRIEWKLNGKRISLDKLKAALDA